MTDELPPLRSLLAELDRQDTSAPAALDLEGRGAAGVVLNEVGTLFYGGDFDLADPCDEVAGAKSAEICGCAVEHLPDEEALPRKYMGRDTLTKSLTKELQCAIIR